MNVTSPTDLVTVYRGVHCQHPELNNAKLGRAVPGDLNGTVTPDEHNAGGFSDRSPLTSWTTRREVAEYYAARRSGGKGIVLTNVVAQSQIILSPDIMNENEVLLQGIVDGCVVAEIAGIGILFVP